MRGASARRHNDLISVARFEVVGPRRPKKMVRRPKAGDFFVWRRAWCFSFKVAAVWCLVRVCVANRAEHVGLEWPTRFGRQADRARWAAVARLAAGWLMRNGLSARPSGAPAILIRSCRHVSHGLACGEGGERWGLVHSSRRYADMTSHVTH